MKAFLAQVAGSSGIGPSSLTCYWQQKYTDYAAKAYAAEFVDKSARQEARKEHNNPQVFVPSTGVRHMPSKKKKERTYRNIHVGLGRQLQEADCILANDEE